MRVLIIEDDNGISSALKQLLSAQGYAVDAVFNIKIATNMLQTEAFDLILLDLTLPDGDGSNLLKNIRNNKRHLNHQTPVLIMTARDAVIHMVTNLDLGADDYLVKPFVIEVLMARINAVIRRAVGSSVPIFTYKNLELCLTKHTLKKNGELVDLSAKEFSLLQKLVQNQGCVFTRAQLEQAIYNFDNLVESNAIEVHIHNLRKKLGKNIIKTVRGVGYFAPDN